MTRVLFFGTDALAGHVLRKIHENTPTLIKDLQVVSPPNRSRRLGPSIMVRDIANQLNIAVHDAPDLRNRKSIKVPFNEWSIPCSGFDVGVVFSFGYFIPQELVRCFPMGMLNIHPSLLPKYRGAAPIYHALMNGETETGVSIIEIDPLTFDTGNIVKQSRVPIPPTMRYSELSRTLIEQGSKDLIDVLKNLDEYRARSVKQQSATGLPRAPKLKKGAGYISFENDDSRTIYNKWRALGESYEVFANWVSGKDGSVRRVCITEMLEPVRPSDLSKFPTVGSGIHIKCGNSNAVLIRCKDDVAIACTKFRFDKRREIDADMFNHGYLRKKFPSGYFSSIQP